MFKIQDVLPYKMFGEKECIYETNRNEVQIIAAAPNTRLVMLHRKDLWKTMTNKEKDQMLVMSQVMFPTEETVK